MAPGKMDQPKWSAPPVNQRDYSSDNLRKSGARSTNPRASCLLPRDRGSRLSKLSSARGPSAADRRFPSPSVDQPFRQSPSPAAPPDPAWNGWDVLRLTLLTIVALFVGVFAVLLTAPLAPVPAHALRRDRAHPAGHSRRTSRWRTFSSSPTCMCWSRVSAIAPIFWRAIHWNWPSNIAVYCRWPASCSRSDCKPWRILPIPKELPIDSFFRTPPKPGRLAS